MVFFLSRKGLSAKDIHLDIVHTLGPDAIGYSTVALDLRDAPCASPMHPEAALDDNHEPDDTDQAILAAFSEHPFASVRKLSQLTRFEVNGATMSEAIAALSCATSSLDPLRSDT
jgi:hypothetical protein